MGVTTTEVPAKQLTGAPALVDRLDDLLAGRRFAGAVAACVTLAVVAAAPAIAREPLERDELETLALVSPSFGDLVDTLSSRQNGMLFDLALWPVVHLGGDSPVWLRLPSLLAFLGAVVVAACVGRRLAGRAIGIAAALLLAVHPFAVEYAQVGRPYTFALFFTLLATWFLLRALERPSAVAFGAYAVAAAAAFYSHDLAILGMLGHLVLVVTSRNRAVKRWFLAGAVGMVALAIPLLLFIPSDIGASLSWIPSPWPGTAARTVKAMAGSWAAIPVCIALLTGGAMAYWRLRRERRALPLGPVQLGFLGVWLVGPFTVAFLVSLAQPIFVDRYLLPSLPALCVLLAASVVLLASLSPRPRRWLGAGFATLAVAFGVSTAWKDISTQNVDWPGVVAFVEENAAPDEAIAFAGEAVQNANAFLYYSDELFPEGKPPLLRGMGEAGRLPSRFLLLDFPLLGTEKLRAAVSKSNVWIVDWGGRGKSDREAVANALEGCTVEPRSSASGAIIYYVSGCAAG